MKTDPRTALERCETLMLDMDGTILDLAFDNYVWKDLVPRRFAARNELALDDARTHLFDLYGSVDGDLEWYCLDHWSERLDMDVIALHHDVSHRIGYLPGAREFLARVREMNVRVLLVTNSHPGTLELKDAVTGLGDFFDGMHSSHTYGHAKERQDFWHALQEAEDFDPATTLFIDDTQSVLQSACKYGVEMLLTITVPDTSEPRRTGSDFAGVENLLDLLQ
jgi:putative hydrolase of the HAD superfamily